MGVYLPGLAALPPLDRDESRFAQASRQMAESEEWGGGEGGGGRGDGGWIVPHIQETPRLNKPPLIYWLQAACVRAIGDEGRLYEGIWVYRLPSVLAAIITVLLTWRLGVSMFDPRAAWVGALLLAVCPIIVAEAHEARADGMLLTTATAAQAALWSVWRSRRDGDGRPRPWLPPLAFWTAISLGILTKGPITPMVAGLTALTLSVAAREWRWLTRLRPITGLALVALFVGPWVYAVGEWYGWDRYLALLRREIIGRAASPIDGHWGPPGYHLVFLPLLFWPGSLLTALAIARAFKRGFPAVRAGKEGGPPSRGAGWARLRRAFRRSPSREAELFCLAWIVPSWLVFELASTKLPHYTMPLYPALALLSARALFAAEDGGGVLPAARSAASRIGFTIWLVLGLAITGATAALLVFWRIFEPLPEALPSLFGVAILLVIAYRLVRARRAIAAGRFLAAMRTATICAIVVSPLLLAFALPPHIALSPRIVAALDAADPARTRPFAATDYYQDSLVFLTRGRVQRLDPADLDRWAAEHPDGLVLVRQHTPGYDEYQEAVAATFTGLNYSKGRLEPLALLDLSLYTLRTQQGP